MYGYILYMYSIYTCICVYTHIYMYIYMTFSGFDPFLGLSNTFTPAPVQLFFIVNTHMTSLHQHIFWFVISSFWERSHIWSLLSEFVRREVEWYQNTARTQSGRSESPLEMRLRQSSEFSRGNEVRRSSRVKPVLSLLVCLPSKFRIQV